MFDPLDVIENGLPSLGITFTGYQVYVGLAAVLMAGAFGAPIPEDIPLIAAGVFIHEGKAKAWIVFLIAYSALLLGDLLIYTIGYKFGFSLLRSSLVSRRITPERLADIHARMDKHAVSMIFLARHLFYLRTATLLACGAFRMRLTRFLIIDAFAAALSSSVMISVGYLTAQHLPALFRFLQTVKIASLVVILIMLVLALIYFRKRRAVEE